MLYNNFVSGLTGLFFYIALPFFLLFTGEVKSREKPNVVFIFADDMGWGDLSAYGNDRFARRGLTTPHLDKMADEGTLFTHFYAPGSVCSPSRAGVMTGHFPARNRIFAHISNEEANARRQMPNGLDTELFSLFDMFNQAGYTTAHFGKWHLGDNRPTDFGANVYKTQYSTNIVGEEPLDLTSMGALPHHTGYILDETISFINEYGDQPFYANVWLKDVHAILNPTEEQLEYTAEFKPRGNTRFYGAEQVYYASLLEMDRQIGRFLQYLDEKGLSDNTLIIFASDNGPEDFQIANSAHSGVGNAGPFRGRKRSVYEGGIRVPFILKWPGSIPYGKVNNTSEVNGIDFIPTLASIVGSELPDNLNLDGEDMSDVWLGSDRKREKTMYWEWRYDIYSHPIHISPVIAIREGDYKLLINPDGSRVELFNLINDPTETQNLAYQKQYLAGKLSKKALDLFHSMPDGPMRPNAGSNVWESWPE